MKEEIQENSEENRMDVIDWVYTNETGHKSSDDLMIDKDDKLLLCKVKKKTCSQGAKNQGMLERRLKQSISRPFLESC